MIKRIIYCFFTNKFKKEILQSTEKIKLKAVNNNPRSLKINQIKNMKKWLLPQKYKAFR